MRLVPAGVSSGRAQERIRQVTETALRTGLEQLVRRNLRGVWVRGELPTGGVVWASNHHSWWDFFVAAAALRTVGRSDVGVLMNADNLQRPQFFGSVGVVGTDRLRTAVAMLADGIVLVVFPEGELRAPGPLGPTRRGAGWLAGHAEVPVLAVGTRVVLRGQQAAEAYLRISPVGDGPAVDQTLRSELAALDDELSTADPEQPLPGYRQLVSGVSSWNERFAVLRTGRR